MNTQTIFEYKKESLMNYKQTVFYVPSFLLLIGMWITNPIDIHAQCVKLDNAIQTVPDTCGKGKGKMEFKVSIDPSNCGCDPGNLTYSYRLAVNDSTDNVNPFNSSPVKIKGLLAGADTLIIYTKKGPSFVVCDTVAFPFVIEGIGLKIDTSNVTASACTNNSGSFTVTVSGGVPPYTVSTDNMQKTILVDSASTTFQDLSIKTYTIQVSDNTGCTGATTVQIGPITPVTVELMGVNPVSCKGGNDGKIKVTTPAANTSGYSYNINTSANFNGNTNEYSGLTAGTYTITVKHELSGCTGSEMITVSEPALLEISYEVDNVSCKGGDDGGIDVEVNGGNGGYNFKWSNLATTEDIMNLSPGMYSLLVTDIKGCKDSLSNIAVSDASDVELDIDFDSLIISGQSPEIRPMVDPSGYYFEWRILENGNVNVAPAPGSVNTIMEGEAIGHTLSLKDDRSIGSVIYEIQTIKLNNPDCIARIDTVEVFVKPNLDNTPFIPEIYTPNGDGQNDEWLIIMPPDVDEGDYTLFNRLGGKVFEADINTLWDGTGCPDGPYFYVLRYTQGGEEKIIKGVVTIIRTSGR